MSDGAGMRRRGFMTGAALLAAAPAMAEAAASRIEAPWTGGGDIPRAGGVIRYRTLGPSNGEPVLLLHKVGGWLADWRAVAPLLAARHRVIAMDLPGHGGSAMLGRPPHVQTVAESAALILASLSELGVNRFAVAGNSLGGIVGINLAARYPERVSRLILASVSLFAGQSREELDKVEADRDPAVWTADWRPKPRSMAQVSRFGTVNPVIEEEQNASRARADRWVRPSERGVALSNTEALLAKTTAPLLMIYADRGYYTRYVETGRRARPDATIVQVAGAGSFVHQEKPEDTARAMVAFLG
ncbi:alpha/beta fold hydrolase [Sphingobium sp.]|uniref:alpha/beta fold hydrolase n=1 Tax=Sphingobium sp. TaxID=1912891 RepID=UPI0035C726BE